MNLGLKIAVGAGAAGLFLQWPLRNYQFNQLTATGSTAESDEIDLPPPPSIGEEGPNFVNFQTSWCGYCQRLAPVWEELEKSCGNKCKITSIDCEREKDTCKRYGVKGYPTLVLFNDGKPIARYRGPRNLEDFKTFLRNFEEAAATSPAS